MNEEELYDITENILEDILEDVLSKISNDVYSFDGFQKIEDENVIHNRIIYNEFFDNSDDYIYIKNNVYIIRHY